MEKAAVKKRQFAVVNSMDTKIYNSMIAEFEADRSGRRKSDAGGSATSSTRL